MSILVTGASGAFGGNYAKRMLELGHDVISIRHDEAPVDTASLLGIRGKITWARGSITDENFVKRVVADYAVDTIVHFAALPLVQCATRTSIPIFQTNFMGTINLLEAVKDNHFAGKDIKFVFVSTDKAYGDSGGRPYTEDMPLDGLGTLYDASKAAADLAVRTYRSCGYAPYVVVARPCNILAPGDLNLGRAFARLLFPALRNEAAVLYSGDGLREYISVEDAVLAIYMLAQNIKEPQINGQAFNVGSGYQRSIKEITAAVYRCIPSAPEPAWVAAPEMSRVEIPFQKLDSNKIFEAVLWKARVRPEQAIEKLVAWWRSVWDQLPPGLRNKRIEGWHG